MSGYAEIVFSKCALVWTYCSVATSITRLLTTRHSATAPVEYLRRHLWPIYRDSKKRLEADVVAACLGYGK